MKKKKILKKMHKGGGGIGDILASTICLMVIISVMTAGVYFFRLMEIKKDINTEARSALLTLEQNGELTKEEVDSIKTQIVKMGFSLNKITIVYNGNNEKAKYGNEVSINVRAEASNTELNMSKIFNLFKKEMVFSVDMHSISKAEA